MARWTPTAPAGWRFRMDHGRQYRSDHGLKQIRYWGVHPSFGCVEAPATNGGAERWNRTLKEQAIHGRIVQHLEAVRAAVANCVERYNQTWRLETLGYHTPIEAREEDELARRHSTNVCPGNRVRYRLCEVFSLGGVVYPSAARSRLLGSLSAPRAIFHKNL